MPVLLQDTAHLCRVLGVPYSDEQLGAITSDAHRPGVIAAGAGSGKTEVMAARVVWLVGRGHVRPDAVLGLTFTTKAAAELAARIRRALGLLADDAGIADFLQDQGEPTVSTYHAYAGALIAEHGLRLGIEPDLQVVADASRFQRAARVVRSYSGALPTSSTHLPTLVRDLLMLDANLSDHLVEPACLRDWCQELVDRLSGDAAPKPVRRAVDAARRRIELSRLVEAYRAAKVDAGVMDFADQMARGAQLATSCPEVSRAERDRFAVVLLDEYQDTSVAQRLMLQGLYSAADAASGRGHPVTAVGDVCQAIYGWRGASADNLAGFLGHFPAASGARGDAHALSVNRRCGASILELANELARPIHDASTVALALQPRPDAPEGQVRVACLSTVAEEVAWIGDQILALGAGAGADVGADAVAWSDIAVLVRDRRELAALASALRERAVPVEVVGMSGLLSQPEVEDVVAVLEVIDSVTANAALLRLLTGPRWCVGARDLALLGTRARQLVSGPYDPPSAELADELARAVSGVDPADVLSLADALDDPGALEYSAEARHRFAELSGLLRRLRAHAGDPPPDLTRQVIAALDLDVELATQTSPAARQAQDNLALLLEAVSDFCERGQASLSGLLAYLRAEDEWGEGMEIAAPSDTDSVKLLTVHKAKGLEWAHVFVPFLSAGVFPSDQPRERYTTRAAALPTELRGDAASQPRVQEWTSKGLASFNEETRDESLAEELRLGYVATTRAKRLLVLSGHWWGRTQKKPRGPSEYLLLARRWLQDRGEQPDVWAADPAEECSRDGALSNPLLARHASVAWPQPAAGDLVRRRRQVAAEVRDRLADPVEPVSLEEVAAHVNDGDPARDLDRLRRIDADLDKLLAEARESSSQTVVVDLPASLSATTLARLRDDPQGLARDLARPMPRRPSESARFGTRFHAWVESYFGQQMLLEEGELPGRDESDIRDAAELAELVRTFRHGPYADRAPYAMESPFTLQIAGQQIRGRIDAVYLTDQGFEVVDWKTNTNADADPLQLAVYRLAWAEMHGLDTSRVSAAFYYVRRDEVVRYDGAVGGGGGLPGRAELERMLATSAT